MGKYNKRKGSTHTILILNSNLNMTSIYKFKVAIYSIEHFRIHKSLKCILHNISKVQYFFCIIGSLISDLFYINKWKPRNIKCSIYKQLFRFVACAILLGLQCWNRWCQAKFLFAIYTWCISKFFSMTIWCVLRI